MSLSGVLTPPTLSVQQLQAEQAELLHHLAAHKSVLASLERRVGRSLTSLDQHLQHLVAVADVSVNWQDCLSAVQSEVDCLCDLLSDTMLLQKLEAGKVEVQQEPLDLLPLLQDLSRHWMEPKSGEPVRLLRTLAQDLPRAYADRELTEAVVTDLLARGLRYSDSDHLVRLETSWVKEQLQITITAQRFAPPGDREFATEIMLCCRRVEVQQGQVTCQSAPDGMKTVTIVLPSCGSSGSMPSSIVSELATGR